MGYLEDYISQERSLGKSDADIRASLIQTGWREEQAMAVLPVQQRSHVSLIVIIVIVIMSLAGGYFVGGYASDYVWGPQTKEGESQYVRKTGFPFPVAQFRYTHPAASTIDGCRKVNVENGLCGIGVALVDQAPGCTPNIGACWNDVTSNSATYLNYTVWALGCFSVFSAAYLLTRTVVRKFHR
ncbi:MAG: hypothetical protein PHY34_03140 [Patescibacteria group bacterium]|nr:hypothetical protein [Patescibacteria group bacterium]MDD5716129.1 hypothetical protein [Patescibacteria group bacterium]